MSAADGAAPAGGIPGRGGEHGAGVRPRGWITPGFDQAATVVTASTAPMTISDTAVLISGTPGSSP